MILASVRRQRRTTRLNTSHAARSCAIFSVRAVSFDRARAALNVFYTAAGGKLPVKSYAELVEHYRTHRFSDGEVMKHDDFLEEFEGAVKAAGAKATDAMKRLAQATPAGKLPGTQAFFKALQNSVTNFTASDFAAAVGDGLKEAAIVATAGIGAGVGIYLLIAAGALLLPALLSRKAA